MAQVVGNRFELLDCIGSGDQGRVYRARDVWESTFSALKIFHEKPDPTGLRIWGDIRHPNIVEIRDICLREVSPFVVMEYVPNLPIHDFNTVFGEQYIWKLIRDVLVALRIAHNRGICHGDIKPSNILISKDSMGHPLAVKLTDFGLYKSIGADQESFSGSIAYVAPEIIRGLPVDNRSDIYSFGATLYELVTGRPVFQGPDLRTVFRGHLEESPVHPRVLNPEISEDLNELIIRFLAKEPSEGTFEFESINVYSDMKTVLPEPRWIPRNRPEKMVSRLLELASQGNGGVALIRGDAGTGKSSLLRKLRLEMGLCGNAPIYIDSSESSNERNLTEQLFAMATKTLDRSDADASPGNIDANVQFCLPVDFMEKLRSIEEGRSIQIFIDSVDQNSELIDALQHLIPLAGTESLLIIIALDVPLFSDESGMFAKMSRLPHVRNIPLRRFTVKEMEKLLVSMLATDEIDEKLVNTVHRLSGGLPGLGADVLQYLMKKGYLGEQDGQWITHRLSELDYFDSSLKLLADSVIPALNTTEKELLGRLGLMESPVPEHLVDMILGSDLLDVIEHWDALSDSGLIRLTSRGWVIKQRELLSDAKSLIPENRRPAFHEHVARIIDREFRGDPAWASILIHHLIQAGDHEAAAHRVLEFAGNAAQTDRYGIASRLLEKVVGFIETLTIHDQIKILDLLGHCYIKIGDMTKAKTHLLRIIDSPMIAHVEDSQLVSLHHKLARVLSNTGDMNEARKHVEVIQNDPVLKAFKPNEDLEILAYIAAKQHEWSEAEYYARTCLNNLTESHADNDILSKIENTLGVALLMLGRLTEAEEHIKKSYQLRMDNENYLDAGRCAINLGIFHNKLGQYSDAVHWLRLAETRFDSIGAIAWSAQATDTRANIYRIMGRSQEALKLSIRAIRLAKSSGQKRMEIIALNRQGLIWTNLGETGRAKSCFRKSFDMANRLGHTSTMASAASNLADIERVSGKYGEAEKWYLEAQQLAQKQQSTYTIGNCRVGLAKLYRESGDLASAEKKLNQAMKDLEEANELRGMLYARCERAELLLAKNLSEESKREMDRIDLSTGEFAPGDKSMVFRIQGNIYNRLEMTEEAKIVFKDCLDTADKSGITEIRARAFLDVGKWLAEKGPIRGFRAAERYLTKAKDAFTRIGAVPKIQEIEKVLNEIGGLESSGVPVNESGTRKLSSLYRMMSIANRCHDSNEILTQILDLGVHAVGGERGLIILIDGESDELSVEACTEIDGATIADARRISESIVRQVAGAGVPIYSGDALNDVRFSEYDSIKINRISCFICVPLVLKEQIVGTIYVDSCNMAHQFTESDLTFLAAFAHHAAIAMENLRLREKLEAENLYLQEQLKTVYSFNTLVGHSPAMEAVYAKMTAVAQSPVTVVVQGETGTGKELIARAIHFNSNRSKEKFIPVNCGAMPDSLLESELFGYAKGAFTVAVQSTPGVFVSAHRGTLFLDEITDMSPNLQVRLLRVLESGEIKPLGQPNSREVDVRIVCATNKDLYQEMKAGRIREDLYYRLKVVIIQVPPLRERLQDIPLLMMHFLKKYSQQFGKEIMRYSDEVMSFLCSKEWPGNVRELEHVIEACVALCSTKTIDMDTVEMAVGSAMVAGHTIIPSLTLAEAKSAMERSYISRALRDTGWNVSAAARLLGMNRRQVQRLMKRHDLGSAATYHRSQPARSSS